MPYFFVYNQQTVLNQNNTNSTYCFANFSNYQREVLFTSYTVLMSYFLPLVLALTAYIGLVCNFRKISKMTLAENQIKFKVTERKTNSALVNNIINELEEVENIHNVSLLTITRNSASKVEPIQKTKLKKAKKKQGRVLVLIGSILLVFALTWLVRIFLFSVLVFIKYLINYYL